MMQGTARIVLRNSLSSAATRVLQLTVLLWVNQFLLKRITPEEYSLFPLVMSLMIFADLFKNIFTGGLGRFLVEAHARGDSEQLTSIVSSMLPVLTCAAGVVVLAGMTVIWQIDRILTIEAAYLADARLMLSLLVFMLGLSIVTSPFTVGLYVRQKFHLQNVIDLSCELLRLAILLVLLLAVDTRVVWLVVASTIVGLIKLGILTQQTRRLLPDARFRRDLVCLKATWKLMSFGAWTSVQGLTNLASNTIPLLILNRFGTAIDVSCYHLGRLPDVHVRGLTAAAVNPAQPALTSLYATRGEESLKDLYYRGGRYHLWITMVLIAPLLVFGRSIVELYAGNQYSAAYVVLFALLAAYPATWASAMFYRVTHAIGKVGKYYVCDILVQSANITAIYYAVVISGWGAPGAGVAIGASTFLMHLCLIWPMGLRTIEGSWRTFVRSTIVPGTLPLLAALGACQVSQMLVAIDTWLDIALGSAVAMIVYAAMLFTFCLDDLDRRLLAKLLARVRSKFNPESISNDAPIPVGSLKDSA
jgi:O-antigen/teichoic acid export membrane protein